MFPKSSDSPPHPEEPRKSFLSIPKQVSFSNLQIGLSSAFLPELWLWVFFFNLIGSQREEGATRAGEEDRPREGGGRGEEGGAREGDARPSERTEEAAYGAGVGDGRADGPAPCAVRHPVKGERPPEEFLYFKWENYCFDTHQHAILHFPASFRILS